MNLDLCIVVLDLLEKLLKGLKIEENYGTGHTYRNQLSKVFFNIVSLSFAIQYLKKEHTTA